jgi:mono/diheme cytochrome c family protein
VRRALLGIVLLLGCHRAPAPPPPDPNFRPESQFIALGCVSCHAKGAPYHDKIKACANKPVGDVARWILDARAIKPDTKMPTFSEQLSEAQAWQMAAWVQQNVATQE